MSALLRDDVSLILDGLADRASALRGKHVLVTGASGFFGTWLTEALVALDNRHGLGLTLSLVARNQRQLLARTGHLRNTRIEFLEQDVRSLQLKRQPTHVIHAATSASAALNDRDPAEMISVIVDGTRRVLNATNQAERFLFVSSGAVYGLQTDEFVGEDYLGGPNVTLPGSAYAEGKRVAELLCAIAGKKRSVCTARAFAFVGPWLPLESHFAVGNFLHAALKGKPIVVEGDGTPIRSYLYAADLAVWLLSILLDGAPGRVYNVGSDQPITIRSLANTIGELFGVPVEVRGVPRPNVPAHRYVPSVARAHRELGVSQTIPLSEALFRTVRWQRMQEGEGRSVLCASDTKE
jgi:dTDP-glucose 4,6-dehydratase